MLRHAIRGERPDFLPDPSAAKKRPVRTFSQDTVFRIPKRSDPDDDWTLLGEVGRRVHDAIVAADDFLGEERQTFVVKRLAEIESELGG
jgi:hypothetical protein